MTINKLYLDGCSMTYGLGLDEKDKLNYLLGTKAGFDVTNNSRPGKSNLAIAMDIHRHCLDHDVVVIGWTYSCRFYLESRGNLLDFLPSRRALHVDDEKIGENLEEAYVSIHKQLYTIYDHHFYEDLSDMLIITTYFNLIRQGKKVIFFSWENRKIDLDIFYPIVPEKHRIDDEGHLNKEGMKQLYHDITWLYEKTKQR